MQLGITLVILAISVIFFVWGKVRSDLVALGSLVLLIVTGVLSPDAVLAWFANPIVLMMLGLFVVGGAVFQMPKYPAADQKLARAGLVRSGGTLLRG